MQNLYNPLDTFNKSITGAIQENTEIYFKIRASFDTLYFVVKKEGEDEMTYEMKRVSDYFEISLSFSVGLYFYCFKLKDGRYISNKDGFGKLSDTKTDFQLSVYRKDYKTPNWLKGGLIYQIFPDRFNRRNNKKTVEKDKFFHENWYDVPFYKPVNGEILNNDFFGGDFLGIVDKIPYLKDLGVSAIYLNPIFKAYSNHRYDTEDYLKFDELLGKKEDFELLIKTCFDNGIRVILDGVFNHTGSDSVYFDILDKYKNGAYHNKESKYRKWYNFNKQGYESWWGIKTLPSTNKENKEFLDFICGDKGVIQSYTKLGIGGWRLDVVDELPQEFSERIRSAVKKVDEDAIVIGEVWEDASNKISYGKRRQYFLGKELDSVMNYPLKNAIINYVIKEDEKLLSKTVREQIDHYPKMCLDLCMNILSTHDTKRIISVFDDFNFNGKKEEIADRKMNEEQYERAVKRLKIASFLQYTLYGVPSLYYGDEAGLEGGKDPFNRKCYPWGKEDKDLVSWYQFLGKLRKGHSVFIDGELKEEYSNNGIYAYKRVNEKEEIYFLVNLSKEDVCLEFEGKLYNLIENKEINGEIMVKRLEFVALSKNL